MREDLKKYLEYVINTGGNATVAGFDDDWEPIGPMLRRELMPVYIIERDGKLELTEAGRAEIPNEMTEDEAKIAALKFAMEMCHATREATIEECAKVADERAEHYRKFAAETFDPEISAEREYGSEACEHLAKRIRSLSKKEGK